jgi:squalene cyclase
MIPMLMTILMLWTQGETPEERAVRFMQSEVPRWPAENRCFSCHNNGDGARALYLAYRLQYPAVGEVLGGTSGWLQKPLDWGKTGETGFGDEKLARIQFAAALVDADDAGFIKDKGLVGRAAALLLPHQESDGSWQVDAHAGTPSAVTYGPVLATFMARRTLERSQDSRFNDAIARADAWLRRADMATTVNAAAIVLAFESRRKDAASAARLDEAVSVLFSAQNADGGWGAYPKTPAEPFETALALLALNTVRDKPEVEARIIRGRAYLVSVQSGDGSWSGSAPTYARHISTSAWATLALISTKR